MTDDQASTIIFDGNGSHFDPDMVDAFAAVAGQFIAISDHDTGGVIIGTYPNRSRASVARRSARSFITSP
jgi:HD-GYP domain-containing protein (c-di-GMP phosphodiesterase class II)